MKNKIIKSFITVVCLIFAISVCCVGSEGTIIPEIVCLVCEAIIGMFVYVNRDRLCTK